MEKERVWYTKNVLCCGGPVTDARPSGWEQKESATWCSNTHHWSDEHNDDHHLVAVYKVRDNEMNIEQGDEQGEGQGDEQGHGQKD